MSYRFDAVMFDLDGTLADTLADIAAAGNHTLATLGLAPIPLPKFRYLAGQGLRCLMEDALGPERQDQVERGMEIFRAYYDQHVLDFAAPYPGIPELLDELTARGLKLAVFSNKPDRFTRIVVEHVLPRWKFAAVVGHRDDQPLKPDPTGALAIVRELGVPSERWLYVGDTKVDMLTAKGAGFFAAGVLWGFRDEPELREAGAMAIVKHPSELLTLL